MTDKRQRLYKLLHTAQRVVCMDDDEFRNEFLPRHGAQLVDGKYSKSSMKVWQLENALQEMKRRGFKSRRKAPDQVDKIRALWRQMAKDGVVRNGTEEALNSYIKRMTGIENVNWLKKKPASANRVIEALKQWHSREIEKTKTKSTS